MRPAVSLRPHQPPHNSPGGPGWPFPSLGTAVPRSEPRPPQMFRQVNQWDTNIRTGHYRCKHNRVWLQTDTLQETCIPIQLHSASGCREPQQHWHIWWGSPQTVDEVTPPYHEFLLRHFTNNYKLIAQKQSDLEVWLKIRALIIKNKIVV